MATPSKVARITAALPAQSRRPHPSSWPWQAATVGTSLLLLAFIWVVDSRFFYRGDKQDQYLPVYRDIGRRLRAGEWLPAIDPALGQSGNYALDIQYGLFEPTHWLVAMGLSLVGHITFAAWLWASLYLVILACGVCAVALKLGAHGPWSAAAGVAAAFSGFVLFWLAPSWIPGLMSLAWVPWWWRAVLGRRSRVVSLLGIAVFGYLIVAGGWPATWLIWVALALGVAVEEWLRGHGHLRGLRSLLPAVLASAAGAVAGAVTVLPLMRAVDATHRHTELANDGLLVANVGDILAFAAPGLMGDIRSIGGSYSVGAPYFFAVWFGLVIVWLVPWSREVMRRPGVITCVVAMTVSILLTQAASDLGPLRWPLRFLPGAHLGLAVFTALLASGRLRVSRRRVTGVFCSVAALTLLTFFRQPVSPSWLVAGIPLAAAAAVLLFVLARHSGRTAGLTALVTTVLLTGGVVVGYSDGGIPDEGYPSRATPGQLRLDTVPTLKLYPKQGDEAEWYTQGVGVGFTQLSERVRAQPGYSSVSQGAWRERFCMTPSDGSTCPKAVDALFEREPTTGRRWVDLLGYDQIAVHDGAHLQHWRAAAPDGWSQRQRSDDFVVFARSDSPAAAGRITAVSGDAQVRADEVGDDTQTYALRSSGGARLVFRDLYWPGYTATLDGERLPVEPVSDVLVSVRVPPGSDGTLELTYEALPTPLWTGTVGAGVLLWLLSVALRRRFG